MILKILAFFTVILGLNICTHANEQANVEILSGILSNSGGSASFYGASIKGRESYRSDFSVGIQALGGSGNISSTLKAENTILMLRLDYELIDKLYLGTGVGLDRQTQKVSSTGVSAAANYGVIGISAGYDLSRKGFSIGFEVGNYYVANNPSQNWAGGFLKLNYWPD